MGRKQTETVSIRLTPEEKLALEERMLQAAAPSMRKFVLDMCLSGRIIVNEDFRSANAELRKQGNNLNQLTRLAHQGKINVVYLGELLNCYRQLLSALGGDPDRNR